MDKDDFLFYRDALSLMMNKEALEWMREKSILKHWILLEEHLNSGTPYAGQPIGKNPDSNTLDCHTNRYIHCAVEEHCTFTLHLNKDDVRNFSMSEPKQLESSHLRLSNLALQREYPLGLEAGVPSSSLVLADYNTIVNHVIMSCYNVQGCVVPCSGNRAGKHKEEGMPHGKRGRVRSRKEYDGPGFIHDNAKAALSEAVSSSEVTYNNDVSQALNSCKD
eukprot:7572043-Ditylum_brightwellii.AAC.1